MRNVSLFFGRLAKSTVLFVGMMAAVSITAQAQDDAKAGEALFKANCTSCHLVQGKRIGPELKGMSERYEEDWLIRWIKNSQAMIASGDPVAVDLFEEYNRLVMTAFPQLSDDDVRNIITYVEVEEERLATTAAAGGAGGGDGGSGGGGSSDASTLMVLGILLIVALAFGIVFILNRVIKTLDRVVAENQDLVPEYAGDMPSASQKYWMTIRRLAKNKKLVFFSVLVLVALLGSVGWKGMMDIGVHEGYMPVQPIKFSHQLHAGVNQIDCQYCHGGAYKSKNASIPSANICMNCHTGITGQEQYGGDISPEIAKIYRALDYDVNTGEYGPNTRPIEWVRIHNLPDFAYFNHSQHVVIAGVECQTCHGPVETMEEVYQYSPLTMAWCIDCHMETEVDTDNAYYDQLIEAHEKLKNGEKMTAAMIGGLECGKCHY